MIICRTWIAAVAAAVVIIVGGAAMASKGHANTERSITVTASGHAVAAPDVAEIATGVVTESGSARDALNANTAAMQKLVDGLKAAGIEAKDLRTSAFSIDPRYTNPRDGTPPSISGYRVTNQVRIVVRDIKRLGEILDQTVTLGANQAGSIDFQVSGAEILKDEARRQAMANALRRARLYTEAAGVTLGKVISIAEDVADGHHPVPFARASLADRAVPIEAGTQLLEARVTVTYALD